MFIRLDSGYSVAHLCYSDGFTVTKVTFAPREGHLCVFIAGFSVS